jgi:transposase
MPKQSLRLFVRPTMRFVEIKAEAQVDLQALHRVRDRIVSNRTQLICQMRAFCLEYGIAMRQGAGVFKIDIARVIGDESNDLTPMMRAMLKELWEEFALVDARLAAVSRQVEAIAERLDAARRLMTIPGIGPLGSIALLAAVGDGCRFRRARDLAAWLGLVPRQGSIELDRARQEAKQPCSASASEATRIYDGLSFMAPGLAFHISTANGTSSASG